MGATHRHATALLFVSIFSFLGATPARSQTVSNRPNATPDAPDAAPSTEPCLDRSSSALSAPAKRTSLWLFAGDSREDWIFPVNAERNCASNESASPAMRFSAYPSSDAGPSLLAIAMPLPLRTYPPVSNLSPAGSRPDTPSRVVTARWIEMPPSSDAVSAELAALGKPGARIERVREGVLEILRSQNACSEWFATKEAAPARTFQSLSFSIDQRGPDHVLETPLPNHLMRLRQPYVAHATQDSGPYTEITINANGAFYRFQEPVVKVLVEGGPEERDGMHVLTVGSYVGNTLEAQLATLLHEFGHIIDLLPPDADDLDGSSGRNTGQVLRHCRPQIESASKQLHSSAKR